MKYRGNKALMKCCKMCKNKKRIRCLGEPKVYKYQGYKFCTACTRPDDYIVERLQAIKKKLEFNQKVQYIKSKDNISKNEIPKILNEINSTIDIEIKKENKIVSAVKKLICKVVNYFAS